MKRMRQAIAAFLLLVLSGCAPFGSREESVGEIRYLIGVSQANLGDLGASA
ncbi:hypothetical protein [Gordoniibacillus kamchatkensis]|uniref:hypothetical protein n=1 Tax=Gordoniibacillus kamchatkensis TaxID=1590651 RepID=UPI000AAF9F1E|nr:hypothetical protein [Paenibacillus sp. VKM B-2647]